MADTYSWVNITEEIATKVDDAVLNELSSLEEEDPFEAAAQLLGITRDELEKIFENSVQWTEFMATNTRHSFTPGVSSFSRIEPFIVTME